MMMNEGNRMIKIGVDISCEDFEFNWKWIGGWINKGAKLVHYTHEGPGGGNPYIELEFPDRELAEGFIAQVNRWMIT